MTYEPPITDYDYIVENCTCAFCGCNCDDLDYLVKDNHVVAVRHACRLGASKIMEDMDQRLIVPMIRDENGELMEVDWDTALDKAAEYIANSVRPVFYGWSETSTECMKEGVALGEYIGAVLDNQATICHGPSLQAVQNAGYPIQTLGEVQNRADVIAYSGSNAMNSHPRHMARYAVFCRGYFRQRGRFDRTVITMDPKFSDTAKCSDKWIGFEQNGDYGFYNAIRAVLRGKELYQDVISGIPKEDIYELAEEMKAAEFGVLFFGLGLTHTLSKQRNIDIAIKMVQDLNRFSKWGLTPMRGHFNVIAADPGAHFPNGANQHLANIPVIQIDIHWGPSTELADVVLPGSFIGVECAGTSYRMDGVPIYMKKAIDKPETCRDDEWIVRELKERVMKLREEPNTAPKYVPNPNAL